MKKLITNLVSLVIIILGCYYIYDHNLFNVKGVIKDFKKEVTVPNNNYYKNYTVITYVKNTTNYVPQNKQDLLNIYYTVINSGWSDFTFYCPDEYIDCINDVKIISEDKLRLLSHLNSYVNPYNIYNNISTIYYQNGKVTLKIQRLYTEAEIIAINRKVNNIYEKVYDANATEKENIKKIHDYIINNTRYDLNKIDNLEDTTYQSNTAYGTLIQGYAVCSGYADTMALFLNKMNIPNIKVANDKHVWNLVNLDNKWYHLDLTWDDPVLDSGEQILSHAFFLIDYKKLESYKTGEHTIDLTIYPEAQ